MSTKIKTFAQTDAPTWSTSEWNESTMAAYWGGYQLSYSPVGDDEHAPKGAKFFWIVEATSEVSETPEVQNSGYAKSENGAQHWAARTVRQAIARRNAALVIERKRDRAAAKAAKPAAKPQAPITGQVVLQEASKAARKPRAKKSA